MVDINTYILLVGGGVISGNEQYLSVHRIRCFGFAFWTWRAITVAWCPLFSANNAVIGHSMSKGIKKETAKSSQAAASCCL